MNFVGMNLEKNNLRIKDKDRYIGPDTLEIKITVDREFIENLEAIKNHLSHKMPTATTKDILAFALRELAKNQNYKQPIKKSERSQQVKDSQQKVIKVLAPASVPMNDQAQLYNPPPAPAVNPQKSRYISIHAKRTAWVNGNGRCQYQDPVTGRRCESKKYLEIDHHIPCAHGGSNKIENLQLLCDAHNRLKGARTT